MDFASKDEIKHLQGDESDKDEQENHETKKTTSTPTTSLITIEQQCVSADDGEHLFSSIRELDTIIWSNKKYKKPESLKEIISARNIDFRQNDLRALPREIWGHLLLLTDLRVLKSQMTWLPELIEQMGHLISLDLSDNKLSGIKSMRIFHTGLVQLSLNNAQLSTLPDDVGILRNLTKLSLDFNQISSLPESIGELGNLLFFSIEKNKLTYVPSSFGELTSLRKFEFLGNQLTSFPDSVTKLKDLREFNVSLNQLESLPKDLGRITELRRIDVRDNQLTSMPDLSPLTYLRQFFFDGNCFDLESHYALRGFRYGNSHIDVTGKGLTCTPPLIQRFSSLQILDLSGNKISVVPEWISELSKLRILNMGNNEISSIPDASKFPKSLFMLCFGFGATPTICSYEGNTYAFEIQHRQLIPRGQQKANQISTMPVYSKMPNLKRLDFSGNYISRLSDTYA